MLLLLLPAAASAQGTVVVLVRHGEELEPDGRDSRLSEAGLARADSLVQALRHARIAAVYTTQYHRTRDTGAAVAAAYGVPHHVVEASRPVADYLAALAARLRREHAGETVLVVGHSNTTPMLVHALGGPQLPEIDDPDHTRFFVLVLDPGGGARLVESRFGQR